MQHRASLSRTSSPNTGGVPGGAPLLIGAIGVLPMAGLWRLVQGQRLPEFRTGIDVLESRLRAWRAGRPDPR